MTMGIGHGRLCRGSDDDDNHKDRKDAKWLRDKLRKTSVKACAPSKSRGRARYLEGAFSPFHDMLFTAARLLHLYSPDEDH
jgi:hypothetical protein